MRVATDHPLAVSLRLRDQTARVAAIEQLTVPASREDLDGLAEVVWLATDAASVVAALRALNRLSSPLISDAIIHALASPHASVRVVAVQLSATRLAADVQSELMTRVREDSSWMVRRDAIRTLGTDPNIRHWQILDAASDPHWRARHSLVPVLLEWGRDSATRSEIITRLTEVRNHRVSGVLSYLADRWGVRDLNAEHSLAPPAPESWCPFWSWDDAVMTRNLTAMGASGRRQAIDLMPRLLEHPESRVHQLATEAIRRDGEPRHIVGSLASAGDHRDLAYSPLMQTLARIDRDRIEQAAREILSLGDPSAGQLAWAIDQIEHAVPASELAELGSLFDSLTAHSWGVRVALARLLGRCPAAANQTRIEGLLGDCEPVVQQAMLQSLVNFGDSVVPSSKVYTLCKSAAGAVRAEAAALVASHDPSCLMSDEFSHDPDARVRWRLAETLVKQNRPVDDEMMSRLAKDPHPLVRRAALTEVRARELCEDPTRETSWAVLEAAARMVRRPIWDLEPEPQLDSIQLKKDATESIVLKEVAFTESRKLGPLETPVCPLAVSGHYHLPTPGFVRAWETGVDTVFWEPSYHTLNRFFGSLSPRDRQAVRVISGTFAADGATVRRHAERVLRALKIEQLTVFLLFWVQGWDRVTDEVRAALDSMKRDGLIAMSGLSTHNRPLAIEAIRAGWNPVMVRHSAAHPGAEEAIFAAAQSAGTSLITFNNTCYGRLLAPMDGLPMIPAADCFRYSLAQPAVRLCLTAPATMEQLDENLEAIRDPRLPEDRRQLLIERGRRVYQEDATFGRLIKSR